MAFRFNEQFKPDMQWMNLSKTLLRASSQIANMEKLEANETKAHEATQREMNNLLGLKQQGLMTGVEYDRIVDKANADAQESGVIRAYENFSMYDELDKSRATMRLNSLDSYMNTPENVALMTHVTDAVSPEAITQQWLTENEGKAIGKDLANNDVFASASGRPSELIAFGVGLKVKQAKLASTLDTVRNEAALEVNNGLFQQEMANHMKAGSGSDVMKGVTAKFKGMGVTDINALTLTAAADIMDNWVSTLDPEDALANINLLEYQLTDEIEMHPGAGMFAAEGTTNGFKLTNAADQARTAVRTKQTQEATLFNNVVSAAEDDYKNLKWQELEVLVASKEDGIFNDTDKAEFKTQMLKELNDPMYAPFDKKALQLEFDNFMSALDVTAEHPEKMVTYLDSLNRNSLDEEGLLKVIDDAKVDFLAQELNYAEYKEVVEDAGGKIKSVRTDTTVTLQATLEKEGQMGWTSLPSATLDETKDFLKTNNFQFYDERTGGWKTAGTKDDTYFRSYQRPAIEYANDLMDAGLYGGEGVKAPLGAETQYTVGEESLMTVNTFTAAESAYLASQGILPEDVAYSVKLLREDFVVGKEAPTTVRESRKLMRKAKAKASAMGAYQAWKQILYFHDNPDFKSGVGATGKKSALNDSNVMGNTPTQD